VDPIEIRDEKIRELAPVFERRVNASGEDAPPWVSPPEVGGYDLFPRRNDGSTLEFLFVVGALNFSYWCRDGEEVETWGVETSTGWVEDVFALCFCLRKAIDGGRFQLNADCYRSMDPEDVAAVFSDDHGHVIPMVESRSRKLNELGRGLERLAEVTGESPRFIDLLKSYRTTPAVLDALEQFFPYSFGDPYQKLSQLLLKMIIDRRDGASTFDLDGTDDWHEATRFLSADSLTAQPDYMLPLYCLKTGLWSVSDELATIYRRRRPLPMDHPLEDSIRRATVETVRLLGEAIDSDSETLQGAVDSVMWMTAVEGCFPVECEGCDFYDICDAVQGTNDRLDWDHHLTRTIHY
jgi:hypothetical protein